MWDKVLDSFAQYGLGGMCVFAMLLMLRYQTTQLIPKILHALATQQKVYREEIAKQRQECTDQHNLILRELVELRAVVSKNKASPFNSEETNDQPRSK